MNDLPIGRNRPFNVVVKLIRQGVSDVAKFFFTLDGFRAEGHSLRICGVSDGTNDTGVGDAKVLERKGGGYFEIVEIEPIMGTVRSIRHKRLDSIQRANVEFLRQRLELEEQHNRLRHLEKGGGTVEPESIVL